MEVRAGYKQTEVGSIPEEWDCVTVQTLVDENILEKPLDGNHGNIHPKSRDFVDYGIPFVMANNFLDGRVDLLGCKFITKERAAKLQKGFSIAGDVLLTHKGTVGNTAIVPELSVDFIMLTPQVTYYRVKDENLLNNGFLRQYLDSQPFQSLFKSLAGGGTRAYLGIVKQLALPIIKPPINEQRAIATALSDVDALLGGLDRLIAKKRNLKQAAMQQLLTGQTRLPGFHGEWEVKLLPEVCRFRGGKAHEQYISEHGRFVCVNSKFISSEGKIRKYATANFCCAKAKDILMVMSDLPNGKALVKTFLADSDNLYAVNQRVCALTVYDDYCAEFLSHILNRNPYFLKFDDGVSQTHLLNPVFQKCPLFLPPTKDEQAAIAAVLSDMDAELAALEARRDKTRALKQAMMQELLTGRTRLV